MKIGRNDPCPCGSGKKFKHCCLRNEKVIPFPEPPSTTPAIPFGKGDIPIHRLMGFESAAEYNQAMESYREYCENEIPEGASIPSFRQFLEGDSPVASVFESLDLAGTLEGADSLEEANRRMAGAVEEYNQTIEKDEVSFEAFEDLFSHGLSRKNRAVALNRSIPTEMIESTPIISLLRGYLEYIVRKGGNIAINDKPFPEDEAAEILKVVKEYSAFDFSITDCGGRKVIFHIFLILRYICLRLGYTLEKTTGEHITDKGLRVLEGKYLKNCYFAALKGYEIDIDWFHNSELPDSIEVLQDFAAVSIFIIARTRDENDPQRVDPKEVFRIINNLVPIENLFTGGDYIKKDELLNLYTDYIFIFFAHLFGFLQIKNTDNRASTDYTYLTTPLFDWLLQWGI